MNTRLDPLSPLLTAIREAVADAVAEAIECALVENDGVPREWLTRSEVARYLRCSVAQVDRRVAQGMPCHTLGKHKRFLVQEVRAWLAGPQKAPGVDAGDDAADFPVAVAGVAAAVHRAAC
jgi:excisionase family DNA binding protein